MGRLLSRPTLTASGGASSQLPPHQLDFETSIRVSYLSASIGLPIRASPDAEHDRDARHVPTNRKFRILAADQRS